MNTGKVQHVFRHFPLDFHPNAMPAAKASLCAGLQKPRYFWDMHDWIFANLEAWSGADDAPAQFRAQVLALGADGAQFDACVASPDTESAIQRDIQDGAALGVSGTPAFFINDWFLAGAYPIGEFETVIAKAEQGLHPPPTPTPLPVGVAPYDEDPARPGTTYDGSPTRGEPDARLVLVAFEDLKCGYCAQFGQAIEPELVKRYVDTGQMRQVFKFLPIYAPKAAVAALCAHEQGKFWEFQDLLFSKQSEWEEGDDAAMLGYAVNLGLDETLFVQCLKEAAGQSQLEADAAIGEQLGVQGTPFFALLDTQTGAGVPIPSALPLEQFERTIQDLLNPPEPTPTS